MAATTLSLLSIPDRILVKEIQVLANTLPDVQNVHLVWSVLNEGWQSCPLVKLETDENIKRILAQNGQIFCSLKLTFAVMGAGEGSVAVVRQPDGLVRLDASFPQAWNASPDVLTSAAIALKAAFGKYLRSNVIETATPELNEFYSRRDSTLLRLEELNVSIICENDEHRRRAEEQFEIRTNELEVAFRNKENRLHAEYAAKEEALTAKEAALDLFKTQLDDRNNTHARRQIQENLKKLLAQRNTDFSLTDKTVQKRLPAGLTFMALIVILTGVAAWALWSTTQPAMAGMPLWFPLARFSISLFALASSLVFYIRWQDRWSEAHATEEFRLKRFDLDVDRASWLVEVMLEWHREKAEIPKELIERLANGLFEQAASGPGLKHPAEDVLGGLLTSASSVNVELPGTKISLKGKEVKVKD